MGFNDVFTGTYGYSPWADKVANFSTMNLSDGTWTFTDPIGMIDTYAYNSVSEFNEIRLNECGDDLLQITNVPSKAPRWSKLATYDDGSPVLGGDNFILTITSVLKGSTAGTLRRIQHMLGVCESVTQGDNPLTENKWSGIGQLWGYTNTDADTSGLIIQGTTAAVISNSANDVSIMGTVSILGSSAVNSVVGLNSSGNNEGSNALAFSGALYSASNQLYLTYLFGANGTESVGPRLFTAGSGTDVSYKYKFTKIINTVI